VWLLERAWMPVQPGDRIVLAAKRQRPVGEQALDDLDALLQALYADSRWVEGQTCPLVLIAVPAGAKAKLEAAAAEPVDRRSFSSQQHRVAIIVR
jgi:hypothetical protein